jgi:indolepyruvate ferredoxin oxidoreductase beta subunit
VGGPAYDVDAILDYLKNSVRNLVTVDAEAAARDLGSAKCLNVVLLGAAVRSGAIGFAVEEMQEAVSKLVPERFLELNRRALLYA